MAQIPSDFKQLFELYNSFGLSKDTYTSTELTTSDIINSLIYNNKVLDEETLKRLSKVKSITYDNEELKKLFVSQQLKNYLIQELLKVFLQKDNLTDEKTEIKTVFDTFPLTETKTDTKTSSEVIQKLEQSFDKHLEYLDRQKDFYDQIEQVITSFKKFKEKHDL